MRSALFITLLTFLLATCGQTGPLYLPESVPATSSADPITAAPVDQGSSP